MKVQIYAKGGFKLIIKDLNRRKAIRGRCLNCSVWSPKEIENCIFADDCQLYPFRSGKGKQDAKLRGAGNKGVLPGFLLCRATLRSSKMCQSILSTVPVSTPQDR